MNNTILEKLTDQQLTMMVQGYLYNYIGYSYEYKGLKLMSVCGSYGRTNLEHINIDYLTFTDKMYVINDLAGAQ